MNPPAMYVDVRQTDSSEQLSLDLTRHLPRRLRTGPAVIINEKPATFLPVIRKRWMRIVREVEKQRSSTLNRERRDALDRELEHMRTLRFKATSSPQAHKADVLILSPEEISDSLLVECSTLYITSELSNEEFMAAAIMLQTSGVVVTYDEWTEQQHQIMLSRLRVPDYGEGVYPVSTGD